MRSFTTQLMLLAAVMAGVGCMPPRAQDAVVKQEVVVPLSTIIVLPAGGDGVASGDDWLALRNVAQLGGRRATQAAPLSGVRWLRDVQRLDSGRPHGTLQYGIDVRESIRP